MKVGDVFELHTNDLCIYCVQHNDAAVRCKCDLQQRWERRVARSPSITVYALDGRYHFYMMGAFISMFIRMGYIDQVFYIKYLCFNQWIYI